MRPATIDKRVRSSSIANAAVAHPQEKEQPRRRSEATDRQIDQLVYQLYGLSDTEIKVVEASTTSAGREG